MPHSRWRILFCRWILFCVSVVSVIVLTGQTTLSASQTAPRLFTVKDGIENASLYAGYGERELTVSRDNRKVALILERGNLSRNETIATLKIYDTDVFRTALSAGAPVRPIAEVSFKSKDNDPPVSALKWSRDSRSIAFLVSQSDGAQVYRLDVQTREIEQVSRERHGVFAFDCGATRCIYLARTQLRGQRGSRNRAITEAAIGELYEGRQSAFFDEFAIHCACDHGKSARRVSDKTFTRFDYRTAKVWLSPNEESAVFYIDSEQIKPGKHWDRYSWPTYLAHREAQLRSGESRSWSQYLHVKLSDGTIAPFMDAPTGRAIANFSWPLAEWSEDGRWIFLSNVLLPLPLTQAPPELTENSYLIAHNTRTGSKVVLMRSPSQRDSDYARFGDVTDLKWNGTANELVVKRGPSRHTRDSQVWRFARKGKRWDTPSLEVIAGHDREVRLLDGWFLAINEDANTPARVVAKDASSGEMVVEDLGADIRDIRRARVESLSWRDKTGREWQGGLMLPDPKQRGSKLPLAIQIYDFQADRFLPNGTFTTAYAAQALASEGFAVLQMRIRDSGAVGSLKEGPALVQGIDAGVTHLASAHNIDRGRVALVGFSRGGFAVQYAITHQNETRFVAAVASDSFDGSYLQYVLAGARGWAGYEAVNEGSPFTGAMQAWIRNAPGFNAANISAALRLEKIGSPLPLSQWEIFSALRRLRRPVELHLIPNGVHNLRRPDDQYYSRQGTVDWLAFWLLGKNPADDESALRWREMRQRFCAGESESFPDSDRANFRRLWCR